MKNKPQFWQAPKVFMSVAILTTIATAKADAVLLIGNTEGNNVVIFDEKTKKFQGNFIPPGLGGLSSPDAITIGPDGNLYISSGGKSSLNVFDPTYPRDSAVLRYSPKGKFLGVAASSYGDLPGFGLTRPYGNAFGPDGHLYVSSFRSNQIIRYHGKTGKRLNVFASDNNSGLGSPNGLNGPNGLVFGPDGSLYVTTQGSANDKDGKLVFTFKSQVLRYSPEQVKGLISTKTPAVFVDQPDVTNLPESPGFVSFLGVQVAPNRKSLYVSDFAAGVRQYDFSGKFLRYISTNYTGTLPSKNFIGALTFGSGKSRNNLYVIGFDTLNKNIGSVLEYRGEKGQLQGSADKFTGTAFTDSSLIRPIGIVACDKCSPKRHK
jgi:sugar lactone lactonase YvrE